jgi:hypothetical protein
MGSTTAAVRRGKVTGSLRGAAIQVHNGRTLELFCRTCSGGQREFWVVGVIKGRRRVINHYFTHDELEKTLAYVVAGDLEWRDAALSEIAKCWADFGLVMGRTLPEGKIVDCERLALHLPLPYLPVERSALAAARRSLPGQWSDGSVMVTLGARNVLELSRDLPEGHPFAAAARCPSPDWWTFGGWQLWLMNRERKSGVRVAVFRVDETELHVAQSSSGDRNAIAHVFQRVEVGAQSVVHRSRGRLTRGG